MCTYALSLVEWEGKGLRGRRGVVRSGTVGFEAKVMCGGHECVLALTSL